MNKKYNYIKSTVRNLLNSAVLSLMLAALTIAQMPTPAPAKTTPAEDYTWWYVSLFVLTLGLVGAIGWWLNTRKNTAAGEANKDKNAKIDNHEHGSLDADKELEWLRKNNGVLNRKGKKKNSQSNFPEGLPARPLKSRLRGAVPDNGLVSSCGHLFEAEYNLHL